MVAPVTGTGRAAPSQLPIGRAEGLPVESVANFDDLADVPKVLLVRRSAPSGLGSTSSASGSGPCRSPMAPVPA